MALSTHPPVDPATVALTALPGVGERIAKQLERLELRTMADLLRHYPHRWVDRREVLRLAAIPRADAAARKQDPEGPRPAHTALVRVVGAREIRPGGGRGGRWGKGRRVPARVQLTVGDESGHALVVFFGAGWRETHFPAGTALLLTGPVGSWQHQLQFQNPEVEFLARDEEAAFHTGSMLPVYPLTRGVTQRQMRGWVKHALEVYAPGWEDPLPVPLREKYRLPGRLQALREYHHPPSPEAAAGARRRLAFEEVFLDQLFVQAARLRREYGKRSPVIPGDGPLVRRVRAALPFSLTGDQQRTVAEILADLARPRPMSRLLQGDVGSGKTVVALLAAAAAADAGLQTAFMAPTEILAEQHLRTLKELAEPFGIVPRLLTGGRKTKARREVLRVLADGSCPLVVGTHALFQAEVRFRALGLVVVDEQHRFGVMQRVALTGKGEAPHLLAMSATPIPRSLALVRFADLELSVIRERPAGRGRIDTHVVAETERDRVYDRLSAELSAGRQGYIIYPLVEDSERSQLQAATTRAEELSRDPRFAKHGVALLHGQMASDAKDEQMSRFAAGEVGVLVATTVVEVGIDVPNANVMIIEHPERYGLSQLHQLRGRIGRGEHDSVCWLVRGDGVDGDTGSRLEKFAAVDDGFALAELDLELRGQGDLGGIRQSGRPGFKLADPWRDRRMTEVAREEAREALETARVLGEGGAVWEPLRRCLAVLLQAAGDLVDAG